MSKDELSEHLVMLADMYDYLADELYDGYKGQQLSQPSLQDLIFEIGVYRGVSKAYRMVSEEIKEVSE